MEGPVRVERGAVARSNGADILKRNRGLRPRPCWVALASLAATPGGAGTSRRLAVGRWAVRQGRADAGLERGRLGPERVAQ